MADEMNVASPEAVTLGWLTTPVTARDPFLDLRDAVVVALGTDRLAEKDDMLPRIGDTDRRGWWADLEAETIWSGWPIGCRLWLLERAKITGPGAREGSLLVRVEDYAHEALQPFLDQRIASRKSVAATRHDLNQIDLLVTLYRGPERAVDLRFDSKWLGIS